MERSSSPPSEHAYSTNLLTALDHDAAFYDLPLGAWTLRLVVRHSYLTEAGWRVGGAWWPVMAGEA